MVRAYVHPSHRHVGNEQISINDRTHQSTTSADQAARALANASKITWSGLTLMCFDYSNIVGLELTDVQGKRGELTKHINDTDQRDKQCQ